MFWKNAPRSRASIWLAIAVVGLLVLAVSLTVASGSFGTLHNVVAFAGGIALFSSPVVALTGIVVGLLARQREGGARSVAALWLNVLLFAGAALLVRAALMIAGG